MKKDYAIKEIAMVKYCQGRLNFQKSKGNATKNARKSKNIGEQESARVKEEVLGLRTIL